MKRVGKMVVCVLGGFALTSATYAVVNEENAADSAPNSGHPYSVIIERNVFDLKAPPVAPSTQPTNTPPPNVKLTGITTILGKKQALFMVQEPAPPGKPANKEESFILSEGQRQGMIEVVEINNNAKAPTVKIKNDGNVSVLTFEKVNLPQAPASAPPSLAGVGSPGGAHMPNMIPPPGGGGYNPQNRFNNGQPGGYTPPNAGGNPNYGGNPNAGGLTTIPTRTTRSQADQQQQQPPLSREEQILIMHAQQQADPNLPPIPPNPLSEGLNQGGGPPGLPR